MEKTLEKIIEEHYRDIAKNIDSKPKSGPWQNREDIPYQENWIVNFERLLHHDNEEVSRLTDWLELALLRAATVGSCFKKVDPDEQWMLYIRPCSGAGDFFKMCHTHISKDYQSLAIIYGQYSKEAIRRMAEDLVWQLIYRCEDVTEAGFNPPYSFVLSATEDYNRFSQAVKKKDMDFLLAYCSLRWATAGADK